MPGNPLFLMPGKCCGCSGVDCGPCCTACLPCPIPNADLTLVINGTTTTKLVYVPAGDESGAMWLDGTHTLACTGGNDALTGGGTWTLASSTCNPFSLTFTSGGDTAVITGPAYGATTCCQTFQVRGCGPDAGCFVPGSVVTVKTSSGGSTLATATVPASGTVTLLWSGSCSVYVTATDPSGSGTLNAYGQSLTLTAGGTTVLNLTPATGFHCFQSCAPQCCYQALDATVNATTPLGAVVLTWQSSGTFGAGWYGTSSWTPPAGQVATSCFPSTNQCDCGSATLTMGWFFDGCAFIEVWGQQQCQALFGCIPATNDSYVGLTLTGGTFAAVTPSGCLPGQTSVQSQNMTFGGLSLSQVCYPFSFSVISSAVAPVTGTFTATP